MNLVNEIQRRNERLVLQRSLLLQQWDRRLKANGSVSFHGAFILAPFVLGAVAPFLLVRQGLIVHLLRTVLLRSVMPFLLPQVAPRDRV